MSSRASPLPSQLLRVWEQGLAWPQQPVRRGLLLLGAACPELAPAEREWLPIGRRDAQLLNLREHLFGARVVSVVACPQCGAQQELDFSIDDIRVPARTEGGEAAEPGLELRWEDYTVAFRLPNSHDLLALAGMSQNAAHGAAAESTAGGIGLELLTRCLIGAWHHAAMIAPELLPPGALAAVELRMSEEDPQADVQLALKCVECGHRWSAPFDIAAFLWSELDAWAVRTLREVHMLARTYGWREADIVSMHPARRDFYLQLVGG